ncbi:MAG: electron transport complex subunit RsxC [Clostridiales bacterium]|jgi:electron transport complex protein RnfC|nr:electron transport complex subunit RsxC [Clostridiales bacterium]
MGLVKEFFKGGANIPHHKNTAECVTEVMGVPEKVVIPMTMHIGAPCDPVVKKGDNVKVGQIIGMSDKFMSSPIHSSVSGTVSDVSPRLYPGGVNVICVEIKTDGLQEVHESVKPPVYSDAKEFLEAIKQSGLVGLGGAGFPAHIKLSPPPDKKIDMLLINGAECEPYITSDYRESIENSQGIIDGIEILIDMLGVEKVLVGIEDNKPTAIEILSKLVEKNNKIKIVKLKTRYPQGAEKMLIYALTGRKVPPGKLPSDVGVIVMNVNSVSFTNDYIKTGMPLIKKRITVDGSAVNKPANVEVLIGTQLEDVFEFCGGFKETPRKVLMGGPMMGVAQHSLQTSVIKNTNALLAFAEIDAELPPESPCIRCGKCVEACPMNLLPLYLNLSITKGDIDGTIKFKVNDCVECGCCSFVCPAKRHLVQSMRLGKTQLRQAAAKKA